MLDLRPVLSKEVLYTDMLSAASLAQFFFIPYKALLDMLPKCQSYAYWGIASFPKEALTTIMRESVCRHGRTAYSPQLDIGISLNGSV